VADDLHATGRTPGRAEGFAVTFSIVARCPDSGQLGVAAVTATPGVGKLLTWAEADVGAVASQAWINPYLGIDALAMLGNGHTAERALRAVIGLDDDRAVRQVGIVDSTGRTAVHTGDRCEAFAGEVQGDGFTVQGNLLESATTLTVCAEAFAASAGEALIDRLLVALEAGEAAGGDKRGARSATAYVVATEQYPLWDIRVDDHDHPLEEVRRLQEVFAEELLPQIRSLPTRENLHGSLDTSSHVGLA
jgi:uncharacterized Ntn-hydrolase superfamily protein